MRLTARGIVPALAGALGGTLVVALGAPSAGAQGPGPMLLDSTAVQPPIVIRIVPENLRPVGDIAAPDDRTVGDPFWATVRTTGPAGAYLLPQSLIDAYRPHAELAVLDSDRRDGQLRLRLALFRPGDVVLPTVNARVALNGGDTILVPVTSDTVRVASVLAPGDTLLADIKPLWRPGGVPAWVWALAAAALAIAIAAWAWRRRRHPAPAAGGGAALDPYDTARRALEAFSEDPPTSGRRTEAAAEIGDTLRSYLADGWGVPARERTTLELLPSLPPRGAAERPSLAALLSSADLAKFARVAPEPGVVPRLAERGLTTLDRLEALRLGGEEATLPAVREAAS
ncbi:MAG TPA: hypothetical protein VM737_02380 [Gemmatimonadota bacterium]|nr:hypothetical protein [Gemmatimonadota bacterium]